MGKHRSDGAQRAWAAWTWLGGVPFGRFVWALVLALSVPGVMAAPGFVPATTLTGAPALTAGGVQLWSPTYYANSPAGPRAAQVLGLDGVTVQAAVGASTGKALRKFVDALPLPSGHPLATTNPSSLGRYIPVAVGEKWVTPDGVTTNDDYYEIAVIEFQDRMHSDLANPTTLRGYVQIATPAWLAAHPMGGFPLYYLGAGNKPDTTRPIMIQKTKVDGSLAFDPATGAPLMTQAIAVEAPHYLGPIVQATRGVAVRYKFRNLLDTGRATTDATGAVTRHGDLFLPVDETISGAGFGADGKTKHTQNRASVHLHGGDNPWISDGTPYQWIAPAGEGDATNPASVAAAYLGNHPGAKVADAAGWLRGAAAMNVPDMADPGPGAMTLYFPNNQSARLLWYHDHTVGLTRVNVYGGMAAPYLLREPGVDAVDATHTASLVSTGVYPADEIPLVIQEHTFVPDDIALQDSKWDVAHWGAPGGDMWFPHVYETNGTSTIPSVLSGANATSPLNVVTNPLAANPAGRWDYGPELNFPSVSGAVLPPDGTLTIDPATGLSNVSTTPEAFMDTALVNGVAYPTLSVDAKAYRLRILNAPNDRYINLGFYVADAKVVSSDLRTETEVAMVPAVAPAPTDLRQPCPATAVIDPATGQPTLPGNPVGSCLPASWPTDGRLEGVPDVAAAGPMIVQVGNEAGLLPTPRRIPSTLITYGANFTALADPLALVNNVDGHGLLLSPAGRADAIVDFSQFACQTLILYNDSPAPTPGADPRYDYFTGDPDNSAIGGAETTRPGFGPNTRTLMQVKVAAPAGATCVGGVAVDGTGARVSATPFTVNDVAFQAAYTARNEPALFDVTAAAAALSAKTASLAYKPSATTVTGAVGTLNQVSASPVMDPKTGKRAKDAAGADLSTVAVAVEDKAIVEYFDPNFGRLNALFGVVTSGGPVGQAYIDAATEHFVADTTSLWRITHQGIDTHPIHMHLTNVQIVARVRQDGTVVPPLPEEMGWRETVSMNPSEDILIAMRPAKPVLNGFGVPNSVRALDPDQPLVDPKTLGPVTTGFTQVDTVTGAARPATNPVANLGAQDFGWEYVWHCHILGHEENDFMRSINFDPLEVATLAPTVVLDEVSVPPVITFTDNAVNEYGYQIWRDGTVLVYDGPARTGTKTSVSVPDADPAVPGASHAWKVVARGAVADGSTTVTVAVPRLLAPTGVTAVADPLLTQVSLQWTNASTGQSAYIVSRCAGANCLPTPVATLAAGATSWLDSTVLAATSYTYSVAATYSNATAAASHTGAAASVTVLSGTAPAAPAAALSSGLATSGVTLNWTASTHAASYLVEQSVAAGPWTAATGTAGTNSFTVTGLLPATAYQFRVTASNGYGSSTPSPVTAVTTLADLKAPGALAATVDPVLAQITLNWSLAAPNASTGQTGYVVARCAGAACTAPVPLATLAATATSYQDLSATAGSVYTYSVYAVSANPASGPAATVSATGGAAPAAPAAPIVSAVTINSASLAWTAATNAQSYTIEQNPGTAWAAASYVLATPTSANLSALVPGTSYQVRVTASNGWGASVPAVVTLTTPADLKAATGLTAVSAGAIVNLAWVDASTGETAYQVERCSGTNTATTCGAANAAWTVLSGALAANSSSYADAGAKAASAYTYRVRALSGTLQGPTSTLAGVTAGTTVAAPASLTVTGASATSATLSWLDNSTNESSFSIERTTFTLDAAGNRVLAAWPAAPLASVARTGASVAATGGTVTYTDATLVAGTFYAYRVSALNAASASSSAASAPAYYQPSVAAPTGLTASSATGTGIVLSWVDASNNETGFEVWRSTDGVNFGTAALATVARTAAQGTSINGAVSYTDATAVIGTTYYYRVRAVSTALALQSAYVGPSLGTAVTLAQPTALAAVLGTATTTTQPVVLNWIDNANNETGYQVERSLSGANAWTTLGAAASAPVTLTRSTTQKTSVGVAVAYTDATAAINTSYDYRVTALSGTGATAFRSLSSMPVTVTTTGAATATSAPGSLVANSASGVSIVLSWIDNSTNETLFNVMRAASGTTTWTQVGTVARSTTQITGTGTSVSYTDATAAIGTTYTYRIDAVTPAGLLSSGTATAALVLNSPINATVAISGSNVVVAWTDTSNNETAFEVVRTAYATSVDAAAALNAIGTPVTFTVARTAAQGTSVNGLVSYTDTAAVPGMWYVYKVHALHVTGLVRTVSTDATTTPATIQAPPMVAPAAPTALIASATSIQVSWTDLSSNETGFVVERSINGGAWLALGTAVPTVTRTAAQGTSVNVAVSYTDTLVAPITTGSYQYRVTAVQHVTNATTAVTTLIAQSAAVASNLVNFAPPAAPTALTAAAATTAGSINLAWTVNSSNETGFVVQYSTSATFATATSVRLTGTGIANLAVSGLTSKTAYFFRVQAVNTVGASAYASTTVAVTAP